VALRAAREQLGEWFKKRRDDADSTINKQIAALRERALALG